MVVNKVKKVEKNFNKIAEKLKHPFYVYCMKVGNVTKYGYFSHLSDVLLEVNYDSSNELTLKIKPIKVITNNPKEVYENLNVPPLEIKVENNRVKVITPNLEDYFVKKPTSKFGIMSDLEIIVQQNETLF